MRRVSLFVHSPVQANLESGVAALRLGDHYAVHELKLDEELFPLLVEAKPCVLMASIDGPDQGNAVYNLMKDFRTYRIKNRGASRDPGLRIVIVSEGKLPRLNWASLGIYEVIIGPVHPNVLTYKMNRHYQKSLTALEVEPEVELDLIKDVELKPVSTIPGWKIFKSSHAEKVENKIFRKSDELIQQLSLRVRIADLDPERGEWRKSLEQTEPPPQWNWEFVEEDPEHGKLTWQFRGEEPTYHLEDQSWQFSSAAPKLLKLNSAKEIVETEFEYLPKAVEGKEPNLKVKPSLDLRSVNSRTYAKPSEKAAVRINQHSPNDEELLCDPVKGLREKPKEQFGERPRDLSDEPFLDYGKKPKTGEASELGPLSSAPKSLSALKPNYGDAPDLLPDGVTPHCGKKPKELSSEGHEPQADENPGREDSIARENYGPRPRSLGDSPTQIKEPLLTSQFKFEQGIIRPVPPKVLSKNTPKAIAARKASVEEGIKPQYGEFRAHEADSPPVLEPPRIDPEADPANYGDVPRRSSDPSKNQQLRPLRPDKLERDTRSNFQEEDANEATESKTAKSRQAIETKAAQKLSGEALDSSSAKIIKSDEMVNSLSILYEEESKSKAKPSADKTKSAADLNFDPHAWNFRMVNRPKTNAEKGLRKIPLMPIKKFSDEQKSSIIDRIVRFIINLFRRK